MSLLAWYQGKRALVTGGAGFIGSHLCEALVSAGVELTILDNFLTGREENLTNIAGKYHLIRGDITHEDTCMSALRGQNIVFHCAARTSVPESEKYPDLYHATNVTGTFNVLEGCRRQGVMRCVFSSSSAVYGSDEGLCVESNLPSPCSLYGLSKYYGERYCRHYALFYGINAVSLRYFNVYGERQLSSGSSAGVVSIFRTRLGAGLPVEVYGDGESRRDFVSVEEVVRANLRAGICAEKYPGEIINVASGTSISINELFTRLKNEFPEYHGEPRYLPARRGDIKNSRADCAKMRRMLYL